MATESDEHISFNNDPVAIYLGADITSENRDTILKIIEDKNKLLSKKISVYLMKVNFQNRNNEIEIEEKPLL